MRILGKAMMVLVGWDLSGLLNEHHLKNFVPYDPKIIFNQFAIYLKLDALGTKRFICS